MSRFNTPSSKRKSKQDESIMATNNSCIVSKRSVEKLYHKKDQGFLRHFVKRFQRRSPLINRGYWLRMKAIDHAVRTFLQDSSLYGRPKAVVNLGCGYDPLPFTLLAEDPSMCQNAHFIDVDYEKLMKQKCDIVRSTPQIRDIVGDETLDIAYDSVLFHSKHYIAVACDLSDEKSLKKMMIDLKLDRFFVLFVAEVSMTYMDVGSADAVIKMASTFPDSRFCLLEQWMPDGPEHPFASTMLRHFDKLQSPIKSPLVYQNMQSQHDRFSRNGWPVVEVQNLWSLWSDDKFISSSERQALDTIEPFDEWEEFALFGCHYFLLVAKAASPEFEPTSVYSQGTEATRHIRTLFSPYRYTHELHRHSASFRRSRDIVSHGGQGTRGRLNSSLVYSVESETELNDRSTEKATNLRLPRLERMFHTICKIGDAEILVAGGRTSPENAFKSCFLGDCNTWSNAPDLPEGIFRHCAVGITTRNNISGVLIFGGKTGTGEILGSWLYWVPGSFEWQKLAIDGEAPSARFAASMSVVAGSDQGHLAGGLTRDGKVLCDLWKWELVFSEQEVSVKCTDVTAAIRPPESLPTSWGRFGASIVERASCLYIVGGVGSSGLVPYSESLLRLDECLTLGSCGLDAAGPRPLLIGHSSELTGDERASSNIAVIGGGATCFSFGSFWNKGAYSILVSEQRTRVQPWTLVSRDDFEVHSNPSVIQPDCARSHNRIHGSVRRRDAVINRDPEESWPEPSVGTERQIDRVQLSGQVAAFEALLATGHPAILESLDLGRCTTTWDLDYLNDKIGSDRRIVVHSSSSSNMDFLDKNFQYRTITFGEFTKAVEAGERMYLRSISSEKPTAKATNLREDFASICDDFSLPPELQNVATNAHSSPLRISGPVNMWLHYDVLCNVYCQIRGRKRLVLFHPSRVDELQFPHGASSSSLGVFDEQGKVRSEIIPLDPFVCDLDAGEVLLIPALWAHAAHAIEGPSIAVNVFFRSLDRGYAAGKDVYGNRDVQAYESGRKDIARMQRAFQSLPADFGRFYLKRLAAELNEAATALTG